MNKEPVTSTTSAPAKFQNTDNDEIMEKPKRPLSAYNYFFRNERKLLLGPDFADKDDSGDPKRRVHRKTHGKYSFGEMARVIAKKWKHLDEDRRLQFEDLAAKDKKRYRQQMKVWKKGSKQQAVKKSAAPKKEDESKPQQKHQNTNAKKKNSKAETMMSKLNDDKIERVSKSADRPESPVSERSAEAPHESDHDESEDETSESPEDNFRRLLHQKRKFAATALSDHDESEEHSSEEAMLRKLLLRRRKAAAAAAMMEDDPRPRLGRNNPAAAHATAAFSALDRNALDRNAALERNVALERNALLRSLAGGVGSGEEEHDQASAAAALQAIHAQRIREEMIHQARMKEIMRCQMLNAQESQQSMLERTLGGRGGVPPPDHPLARFGNNHDALSQLLRERQQQQQQQPNLDALAHPDMRALAAARLQLSQTLRGGDPRPPLTDSMMDSRRLPASFLGDMMM